MRKNLQINSLDGMFSVYPGKRTLLIHPAKRKQEEEQICLPENLNQVRKKYRVNRKNVAPSEIIGGMSHLFMNHLIVKQDWKMIALSNRGVYSYQFHRQYCVLTNTHLHAIRSRLINYGKLACFNQINIFRRQASLSVTYLLIELSTFR